MENSKTLNGMLILKPVLQALTLPSIILGMVETKTIEFDMDYNRVRIEDKKVMPSINKIGLNGSKFQIQSSYERITVEETTNEVCRYLLQVKVFENQHFVGASVNTVMKNDIPAFPSMGMGINFTESRQMLF
jgi:hypothetical protein